MVTIPKCFGRYEIIAELGRGGMATVYHAHDPRFKRVVAIKVLPREYLHDPTFRARFEREARTIAALEHPAIVPVYDFGEEDEQPYLVMRFMPGGSLTERIAKGPVSLEEVIRIMTWIAPAIDEAHAAGVIHRDIKPSNILFDRHGNPCLSDFGIVKLVEPTVHQTTAGIVGTPAYMAPEVTEPKGLSPLVDIYALGVMLFQILSGRLPYEADTPMGMLAAHVTKPIPDVRDFRPDLPADIQAIMEQAMAKDPKDRYQSAGALLSGLQGISVEGPARPDAPSEAPTSDIAIPPTRRSRRGLTLPRWVWITGLIFLICGGATAALLALIGIGANNWATIAALGAVVEPTSTLTPTATDTAVPTSTNTPLPTTTDLPSATPTATATASPTPTPTTAPTSTPVPPTSIPPTATSSLPPLPPVIDPNYYVDDRSGVAGGLDICLAYRWDSTCINLTNHPANDSDPALSPDGTRIVFVTDRHGAGNPEIYTINVDGTGLTRLTYNSTYDTSPEWSPDGTQIYFRSTRDGGWAWYVMNADGSGQTRVPDS